jgi:proteasome lid subunit RPN8/RPN11
MSKRRETDPSRLPFECALTAQRIAALPSFVRWMQINANCEAFAEFELAVELPVSSSAAGTTPKGVRAREPIRVEFPRGFPHVAPRFTLRGNFPRNLPHIQPRMRHDRVEPCLSILSAQEAYAIQGLDGVLNSLEEWLHRAAADNLINPSQGWEPTRRDALGDEIITDIAALRDRAARAGSVALRALFRPTKLWNGERFEEGFYQLIGAEEATALIGLMSLDGVMMTNDGRTGATLCVVVPCARDAAGEPIVYSEFFGGPVAGLGGLVAEASRIGVGGALRAMLDVVSNLWRRDWVGFPLAVILAAKRPLKLIGSDSDIELLPFICRSAADGRFDSGANVRVEHARLTEAVTRPLLQKMSGVAAAIRPLTMIGAGSLGSKVAMHEIRRGEAPNWVVDKGHYQPHHAARHALGPEALTSAIDGAVLKSFAIAELAETYRAKIEWVPYDVLHLLQDREHRAAIFAGEGALILNTTGSVSVRNGLAAASDEIAAGQVVEAGLIGDGNLALITEEGAARNPSGLDLYLAAMAEMGKRAEFSAAFVEADRAQVGEGCASVTLLMPDARVSRLAALVGNHLIDLRGRARANNGVLCLLRFEGLTTEATRLEYAPFVVVQADDEPVWKIRLPAPLAAEIEMLSDRAAPSETGGYLIGRAYEVSRTIVVVAIEPPPPGSRASAGRFVLAPRQEPGLPEATKGGLEVVGTWHSHTAPSDPSPTDYASANEIALTDGRPRTLLIRHPKGWRAIATRALGARSS